MFICSTISGQKFPDFWHNMEIDFLTHYFTAIIYIRNQNKFVFVA